MTLQKDNRHDALGVVRKRLPKYGSRNTPLRTSARSSGYCARSSGYCASTVVFRFHGKPILLLVSILQFMSVQKAVLPLRSSLQLIGYCITFQKQTENLTDLTPRKLFRENVTQIIPDFLRISREQARPPKGNKLTGRCSRSCTRSSLDIIVSLRLTDLVVSTDLAYKLGP